MAKRKKRGKRVVHRHSVHKARKTPKLHHRSSKVSAKAGMKHSRGASNKGKSSKVKKIMAFLRKNSSKSNKVRKKKKL